MRTKEELEDRVLGHVNKKYFTYKEGREILKGMGFKMGLDRLSEGYEHSNLLYQLNPGENKAFYYKKLVKGDK